MNEPLIKRKINEFLLKITKNLKNYKFKTIIFYNKWD